MRLMLKIIEKLKTEWQWFLLRKEGIGRLRRAKKKFRRNL